MTNPPLWLKLFITLHIDKSSICMWKTPKWVFDSLVLIGMAFIAKYAPFGCRRSSEAAGWEAVERGT